MMDGISSNFTYIDWAVIFAYLALTTWVGHCLKGKQSTIKDFFMAGRSLPWQAVAGSIIATEISALTFIGVPGMIFAAKGDLTYLQWAIGSIAARFIVGIYFVKRFYQDDIYSPYDYMAQQLGPGIKLLTTCLFFLGSILGQSVRLLVTAIILRAVTGMDYSLCIFAIGLVAVLWTWMGGMTTVIWTDVMQFGIFIFSGLLALLWIIFHLDGGWPFLWEQSLEAGKLRVLNLSTDPTVEFTLWVGLLAMPFQNLAAFGTDQLNAQRMFCCRNAADARKAIIFSSISQLVTLLMLMVGLGLFAYYQQNPADTPTAELFAKNPDFVFPVWITSVLPTGVAGLILAGAFAAAISSLDSILAALAQTTLALRRKPNQPEDSKKLILQSKILVFFWAVALCCCALALNHLRGDINMVSLAFGMVSYTYGPMLGVFLLALSPLRPRFSAICIGCVLAMLTTLYVRPDLYTILKNFEWITPETAMALKPDLNYAWLYPITTAITFGCGYLSVHLFPRSSAKT
jgi:solute:Na+ symporter, SSS family